MGEIKSTLDLVMERTRHLTLTEEEKREQALSEFRQSLNGLLQKFQDSLLTLDQFSNELERLQKSSGFTEKKILAEELAKRLDVDADNGEILTLMPAVVGLSTAGIVALLNDYRKILASAAEEKADQIKRELSAERGISGSAVVPNLEADADWLAQRDDTRTTFKRLLDQETSRLTASF